MFFNSTLQNLEQHIESIMKEVSHDKDMIDQVVDAFVASPVYTVEKNNGSIDTYEYFLYPFKGSTLINSKLYAHLGSYLARMVPDDTDVIVTIEADGIGIAHFVGAEKELPVIISKHFHYNVPSTSFVQKAGYHARDMYLPLEIVGKRIAIVDCMVSTGGTVKAMIEAIENLEDTPITGIFCVNDKTNYRAKEKMLFGYPYKYLIDTRITNNKVEAKWSWNLKRTFWEKMDDKFYGLTESCSSFSNVSRRGYQVGSIIVDAHTFEILAWGFRRGKLHAEQDAISMLKHNCPDWQDRQLTLYSTMEPCVYRNDKGHIPCSQYIVQELPNCKWIIIGSKDHADDKIFGEGIKLLRNNDKHIRLIETGEIFRPTQTLSNQASQPLSGTLPAVA